MLDISKKGQLLTNNTHQIDFYSKEITGPNVFYCNKKKSLELNKNIKELQTVLKLNYQNFVRTIKILLVNFKYKHIT